MAESTIFSPSDPFHPTRRERKRLQSKPPQEDTEEIGIGNHIATFHLRYVFEGTILTAIIIVIVTITVSIRSWIVQGDSKPLRQTLRVDRANSKEHFLLNNLCILTRRFEVTIDFC